MTQIRLATLDDIPRIMQFIDEHWRKGHIMATNRILFEFQHVEGDEVHYVIAEDEENGKIYGTMGYILMNHSEHPDIATMMIQSLEGSGHVMLGDDMAGFLRKKLSVRYVVAVGVNKRYAKALGMIQENTVDILNHYYRLNDLETYKICKIEEKRIIPVLENKDCILKEIKDIQQFRECMPECELQRMKPYRDSQYINHRYFEHPYYMYKVYGIQNQDKTEAILVGREVAANGNICFRIVDYYGEETAFCNAAYALDELMREQDYEYIDFCNYGMNDKVMKQAGFQNVKHDNNIVPDFFEPFEQRNVDIYIYANSLLDVKIYKAFGDQDRPNIIK